MWDEQEEVTMYRRKPIEVYMYPTVGLIYIATRDGYMLPVWLQKAFTSGKVKISDDYTQLTVTSPVWTKQAEPMDVILGDREGNVWLCNLDVFDDEYEHIPIST